ncbi:MAG TPA: hypothetical protein VF765_12315 [Polyangiaceae bacterium]
MLFCACAKTPPPEPGGAVAITRKAGPVPVPYVASGTAFDATIDQPVDTRISKPGQPVTATVTKPVRAANGNELIPAGAQLEGHIASIQHVPAPRIDLEFDTLVLKEGRVPLRARVVSAQQSHYRAIPAPSGVTSAQPGVTEPQGGTQPGLAQGTSEITIPAGAMLQVSLTSPIVDVRSIR